MRELPNDVIAHLSDLEQDALIDLWTIDLSALGGGTLRFCNYLNEKEESVTFAGNQYQAYPIQISGFEMKSDGKSNRPTLTVANLLGNITALAEQYGDGLGAKVYRRQVYRRHLDAVNFENGNDNADPTQAVVSQWLIEQLTSLTTQSATFSLAAPSETDNARIPARAINAHVCPFVYRGNECPYRGKAVADAKGNPTSDMSKDACGKRLLDCKIRFGVNAVLPFGGFPSVNLMDKS